MTERNRRLCTWSGPLFALLFLVGFGVISRYIPPPLPSDKAAVVAERYRANSTSIRVGMVMTLFAIAYCPACPDAFFTSGPFARNGIFSWWLSLVAFLIYIVVITTLMLRKVNPEMVAEDAAEDLVSTR